MHDEEREAAQEDTPINPKVARILEVLERIEFDFDDNGEPELPGISDRDISKVVP